MRNSSGQTLSLWKNPIAPSAACLSKSDLLTQEVFDVCVIGAGIAGISTAYELVKAGLKVVVFDRGGIGEGETCRTTAHVSMSVDDLYSNIEKWHGAENTRLIADSYREALETIARNVREANIDCDLRRVPGYLFLHDGGDPKIISDEYRAAFQAGVPVEIIEPIGPHFAQGPWLMFPDQIEIHPYKYMAGLVDAIRKLGGCICTHTEIKSVVWESPEHARLSLPNDLQVHSKYVVTATHTPFIDLLEMHTKQAPYRSYVIASKVPRGFLPHAFYWDTDEPYHYLRIYSDPADEKFDHVIIGGEDHKTGQQGESPEMNWRRLEAWARERFPVLGEITHRWSGQIMEPNDGIGYAGVNPLDSKQSFIITGDSGEGFTLATIGARIISDLILGHENRFEKLYSPARKTLKTVGKFLKENLNAFSQYADHFKPTIGQPETRTPADLARGQGAVLRDSGKPVGVYRDPAGRLHACSAICPHLGAVLRWNSAERSWDCPAHGSRFDCNGQVLHGPANRSVDVKVFHEAELEKSRNAPDHAAKAS